jgi:GNAT superfamily N-acetyltransferase
LVEITLRLADPQDAPVLAQLNRQLIEDEQSRNPMSLAELEARMRRWLAGDWSALLILCDGQVAGYGLFQLRCDDYFPEQTVVYVRHYCIARGFRRQGLGRAAFERIVADWFPAGATLELDVLESNPTGRLFWDALGFRPYCTTLKRPPQRY